MLDVESKKFNNGRALTLMRPSPTRLAGELIANHKALRLKPILKAIVTSAAYASVRLLPILFVRRSGPSTRSPSPRTKPPTHPLHSFEPQINRPARRRGVARAAALSSSGRGSW